MNNIINKYLIDGADYYSPKILIKIIEDLLGKKFNAIKEEVSNANITITKEEILECLDKTFEEENPELKRRIENPKPRVKKNLLEMTREDIKRSSQEFVDQIAAARYKFEPYALDYFKKYVKIVKNKAILLLDIIEKLSLKESKLIQENLNNLDIVLAFEEYISKEDIIRLISPTIHNIKTIEEKIENGNKPSTYLTFKLSKHGLYKDGWSEGEIYPSTSIQIKNVYYDHMNGNVPLSENQRNVLAEEENRRIKKHAKIILDALDD